MCVCQLIPVAARSKAQVCGSLLVRIHSGAWICLLWVLCVVGQKSLRRADHSSRRVLPSVVNLSLISKPQQKGTSPTWLRDRKPNSRGSIPDRGKRGFLLQNVNTVPETRQVSRSTGTGDSSSEGTAAGVSRLPPISKEYSTLQQAFMACTG